MRFDSRTDAVNYVKSIAGSNAKFKDSIIEVPTRQSIINQQMAMYRAEQEKTEVDLPDLEYEEKYRIELSHDGRFIVYIKRNGKWYDINNCGGIIS